MKKFFCNFINMINIYSYKRKSKDIIAKNKLKQIKNKDQLIQALYEYYRDFKDLEFERISLNDRIENILEVNTLYKMIGIVTLIITVTLASFTISNSYIGEDSARNYSEINSLKNREEDYYAKTLEIESKIKFTKDETEKKELEDYDEKLKKEIRSVLTQINLEYDNETNSINLKDNFQIKYLLYILGTFYFGVLIEDQNNMKRIRERSYLKMKLDIVNRVILEREQTNAKIDDKQINFKSLVKKFIKSMLV